MTSSVNGVTIGGITPQAKMPQVRAFDGCLKSMTFCMSEQVWRRVKRI